MTTTLQSIEVGRSYNRVLFAGTFDHLHNGHKYVIEQCVNIAHEILYIGLTTSDLLSRKNCPLALQPLSIRKKLVKDFVNDLLARQGKERLTVVYLETSDPVGPAGTLDFDALIVTPETVQGGSLVNKKRLENGCNSVDVLVVPILDNLAIDNKLSSSSVRGLICDQLPNKEHDLVILKESLVDVLRFFSADETAIEEAWSELRDMYALGPKRHYHNLRHVLELVVGATTKSHEMMLTIWFHDCVYLPSSCDNEEHCVERLVDLGNRLSIPETVIANVRKTILLTKNHREALRNRSMLEAWQIEFLELDLSILGSASDRYHEYSTAIRFEYDYLSSAAFKEGRTAFLNSMKNFEFLAIKNSVQVTANLRQNIDNELNELLNTT